VERELFADAFDSAQDVCEGPLSLTGVLTTSARLCFPEGEGEGVGDREKPGLSDDTGRIRRLDLR